MAEGVYNRFKKELLDGTTKLYSDTIKALLAAGAYTFNADHDFVSQTGIASTELSGTGYASGFAGAGRKTLASHAFTEDDTNDWGKWTAANLTWTAINAGTAAFLVVYKHITSDAASVLISYHDTGFPVVTNGGDLNVNWNANGIMTLS